jgi:heat-inducible transcriptional repressor
MDKKEKRELAVLGHIIREFVNEPLPVSSRAVARRMKNTLSSATVRNIMARLEDKGYVYQPHTSAGRVPTDKGYRKFVDAAKKQIILQRKEARRLQQEYSRRISTMQEVIETTSRILSRELKGAGVIMWPHVQNFYLKHMELVKLKAGTVMAVLVTMTNAVKNYIVDLDVDLKRSDLQVLSNYINEQYAETELSDIYRKLGSMMEAVLREGRASGIGLAKAALNIIDTIITDNIESEIYWEGIRFFMQETDNEDLETARSIMRIFSQRKDLMDLLSRELPERNIRIYIGRESKFKIMEDCSVITSGYSMKGVTVGRFGLIGPTRLDYSRAIGIISLMSDLISRKLEEIEG